MEKAIVTVMLEAASLSAPSTAVGIFALNGKCSFHSYSPYVNKTRIELTTAHPLKTISFEMEMDQKEL